MSELREVSGVEEPVVEFARRNGWKVRKLQFIGRRSAPDRLFFKKDRLPIFVEFKRPGKKPDVQQQREIDRMRANGLTVYVISDVDEGCRIFYG